jgi:hypothetical protein
VIEQQFKNDKSTVFSICPYELHEFKPGLYPGHYYIPACLDDRLPNRLVVGPSEHMMTIGGQKRPLRVTTPSYEIAAAIVRDFLNGQLYTEADKHPGICWIQGDVSLENLNQETHQEMKTTQKKWMVLVVQKTEDDWKKYKNSRVVSDQARFAVRALGLETPEWMKIEEVGLAFNACPACNTKNDPDNVICTNCKCVLNEAKFAKLKFA